MNAGFKGGLFTGFFNALFNFLLRFFYHFFNPRRVNTAVGNQLFQS